MTAARWPTAQPSQVTRSSDRGASRPTARVGSPRAVPASSGADGLAPHTTTVTAGAAGAVSRKPSKILLPAGTRREGDAWIVTVPLEAKSLANTRGQWRTLAGIKAKQRKIVKRRFRRSGSRKRARAPSPLPELGVTLTRVAPRELDTTTSAVQAPRRDAERQPARLAAATSRSPRVTCIAHVTSADEAVRRRDPISFARCRMTVHSRKPAHPRHAPNLLHLQRIRLIR
jgi:hypothetical protein